MNSISSSRIATRYRQSSAPFRQESEILVSRLPPEKEAWKYHETSGLSFKESVLPNTANVSSIFLRVTGQIEDSADDEDEPGAFNTGNDGQGLRRVGFAEDGRHRARTTENVSAVMQTVSIDGSKMFMDRDVWVTANGE